MGKQEGTCKLKKQQLQQVAALVSFQPQGVALPSHAQPSHSQTLDPHYTLEPLIADARVRFSN